MKVCAVTFVILGSLALALTLGVPNLPAIRARVIGAGPWAPIMFVTLYGVMALIPWPRALLTVAGGTLFGLWAGAGLSLVGSLVGATASFGAARVVGRRAIERIALLRCAQADASLHNRGLFTVLALRLAPVVPFIAVNYGSGLSALRFRHFFVGSALGMAPGALAYSAVGAYGTHPWGPAGASFLIAVVILATVWRRRGTGARHRRLRVPESHTRCSEGECT